MRRCSLFFLIIIAFTSCSPPSVIVVPPFQKIQFHDIQAGNNDKIGFLTFNITLTDSLNDQYDVTLLNSKLADGILKKISFTSSGDIDKDYFYFELSENQKGKKKYQRIENPLRKHYEYADENGQFQQAVITKKTGTITIRFQYNLLLKYFLLYKPDSLKLKPLYRASILH